MLVVAVMSAPGRPYRQGGYQSGFQSGYQQQAYQPQQQVYRPQPILGGYANVAFDRPYGGNSYGGQSFENK